MLINVLININYNIIYNDITSFPLINIKNVNHNDNIGVRTRSSAVCMVNHVTRKSLKGQLTSTNLSYDNIFFVSIFYDLAFESIDITKKTVHLRLIF